MSNTVTVEESLKIDFEIEISACSIQTFDSVLAVCVSRGLAIVEGDLLPSLDLPLGEQAKAGHVGIQAVHIHVEDVQVGVAAGRFTILSEKKLWNDLCPIPVVDEAADVAIEGSITCVRVLILTVEVEVEEIGSENKEYSDPYVRTLPNTKQVKSYKAQGGLTFPRRRTSSLFLPPPRW